MIQGLEIIPLKQIKNDQGMIMHWIREDSPYFKSFGEAYFSTVNQGVVKAWKLHKEVTQHLVVPHGEAKFVVYDPRESSGTKGECQEILIGQDNFNLLIIPPHLWYGFESRSNNYTLIANCIDQPFSEGETERLDLINDTVPYKWKV